MNVPVRDFLEAAKREGVRLVWRPKGAGYSDRWARFRMWLIARLAGRDQVAINLVFVDAVLTVRPGNRFFAYNAHETR